MVSYRKRKDFFGPMTHCTTPKPPEKCGQFIKLIRAYLSREIAWLMAANAKCGSVCSTYA